MTIAPHAPAPQPLRTAAPATPRNTGTRRDSGIDLVRALCVLGVVLLHAIMVGVTVDGALPVFENASVGTGWIVPLSWALQVMPLFFVIGGFSGISALRASLARGANGWDFLAARVHRLLRPAVVTVAVVTLALAVLTVAGVPADLIATAGFRYGQPLWFLAVFLLCQALLPLFAHLHERAPLRTLSTLILAAVLVDVLRTGTGIDAWGFLNLAFVWLALQQGGFFLADGRIDALRRGTRLAAAVGAAAVLAVVFLSGVHSPDLIENINPPTTALILVGIVHTSLLSLLRERIGRLSRTAPAAAFTGFVTRRAMTIYLWHMPVLLSMAGATAAWALLGGATLPALDSTGWWAGRPLWLATTLTLTALVAVAFTRFESGPAPTVRRSGAPLALATLAGLVGVVLLLVLGTSVATGALAVALLLGAGRLAHGRTPASSPAGAL